MTAAKPDTCGCCEPAAPAVPVKIDNRPGLSAVAYRVGSYSSFRRALLEAIAGTPELAALKTRRSDDYAITIFELWATIADILTFYQERIANEGYLRTARFRDSVLRMARLLDYHLGPGAAATAELAFTAEEGATVEIPVGLRVQSVPGQDEKPQKFETLETIAADAAWNRLRVVPHPVPVNPLSKGSTEAYLPPVGSSLATVQELAPGDHLLVFKNGASDPIEELEVKELRIEHDRMVLAWATAIQYSTWDGTSQAYKLGRRFRLFGFDAPAQHMRPAEDTTVAGGIKWTLEPTDYTYSTTDLRLDSSYDEIMVGARLLLSIEGGNQTLVTVTEVGQAQASVGPTSDTVTSLKVSPGLAPGVDRRSVLIHELVGPPVYFWHLTYPNVLKPDSVYVPGRRLSMRLMEVGRSLTADGYQEGVKLDVTAIEVGRRVLLEDGRRTAAASIRSSSVGDLMGGENYLRLDLETDFESVLDPTSTVLLGNVARASHGETVKEEVLGDGDAAAVFQRFELKKKPLTYVPSSGPGGLDSSLRVLVHRALWRQVRNLYGQPPAARVYTTRIADDGTVSVGFGDGVTGARTFSGRGNVTAVYRHGTGLEGRVRDGTLTTLLDRPVGLKSVTNPRPAEGGADPESLEEARENAPTTVRTFGRAVSLLDFEDLATAGGEVAKALATWVWSLDGRVVHLTVAGQEAATFSAEGLSRIHASLTAARDPNRPLVVDNFVRVPLVIGATLHVAGDRVAGDVEAAARSALETALSFEALRFGQPLHLSDVYQVLQQVGGVAWLKIDLFQFKDQSPAFLASRGADADPVQEHLRIYPARPVPGPPADLLPAEQAWIESPAHDLTFLTSGGLPV